MRSFAYTFEAEHTFRFNKNIYFLLLKVSSSDVSCVSRLQTDSVNVNEFFRWVQGKRFESTTKLLKLSGAKAGKRSEDSEFTSVFGAL